MGCKLAFHILQVFPAKLNTHTDWHETDISALADPTVISEAEPRPMVISAPPQINRWPSGELDCCCVFCTSLIGRLFPVRSSDCLLITLIQLFLVG